MVEYEHPYTLTAFFEHRKPMKWDIIKNLKKFSWWLNRKHSGWTHFNVYDRKTGKFLKQYRPGMLITTNVE